MMQILMLRFHSGAFVVTVLCSETLDYFLANIKCYDRISANENYESVKIEIDSIVMPPV